jgi:hypothetical protein
MRDPYEDQLVVPLDLYIKRLSCDLSEAEWEDDQETVKRLHQRMEFAKTLAELGELYWTKF